FSAQTYRHRGRHFADRFPSHSPPQLVEPHPEVHATLIRPTRTPDPISSIPAPAKTRLQALNEQKAGPFPLHRSESTGPCLRFQIGRAGEAGIEMGRHDA